MAVRTRTALGHVLALAIALIALCLGAPLGAYAQPSPAGIARLGAITAGHCASWAGPSQLKDAGAACGTGGGGGTVTMTALTVTQSGAGTVAANTAEFPGFNTVETDTAGVASSAVNTSAPSMSTTAQGITVPAAWDGHVALIIGAGQLTGTGSANVTLYCKLMDSTGTTFALGGMSGTTGTTNYYRSCTTFAVLHTGNIIGLTWFSNVAGSLTGGSADNRLSVLVF